MTSSSNSCRLSATSFGESMASAFSFSFFSASFFCSSSGAAAAAVCAADGSPGCATGAGARYDAPEAAASIGALSAERRRFVTGTSAEVVALKAAGASFGRCGAGTASAPAANAAAAADAVALEAAGSCDLVAAAATASSCQGSVKDFSVKRSNVEFRTSVTSRKIAHILAWSVSENGARGFHHRAMLFAFTWLAVHPSSMIAPVAARLTRTSYGLWWPPPFKVRPSAGFLFEWSRLLSILYLVTWSTSGCSRNQGFHAGDVGHVLPR